MIATFPQVHAALLTLSAIGAVAFGAVILARHPRVEAARVHFVYASALAWWFASMAMAAAASSESEAQLWARLVQISIGMLPGISYHLNVAVAELTERYRNRIRIHWGLSVALTLFALFWPDMLSTPGSFAWGFYPRYTAWGLLLFGHLAVAVVGIFEAYAAALKMDESRTARHQKARAYVAANVLAILASVDFLPAFGIGVYPFGYVVVSAVHAIVLYGSVRYQLIEFTPEFAAEHVLKEIPDGLLVIDTRGVVETVNDPAAECLGYEARDLVGRSLEELDSPQELLDVLRAGELAAAVQVVSCEPEPGVRRHLRASVSDIKDQLGFPRARLWMLHDITDARRAREERGRLEESMRNMQKLESLGVMASGIAHDFNNILLAILGNAELAAKKASGAPDVVEHLGKIESAAERAAELTGQMLTYTGNRPASRLPIDLNDLVGGLTDLMGAAISKKVDLRLQLGSELPHVMGDPGQMSQVIMNLITNAAEALEGESGSVTLRTRVARPDDSFHAWLDAPDLVEAKEHVLLEVEDSGVGMNPAMREKIFDPFFTTKFAGRGLGLATVVGIVRSHHGRTRVKSALGHGTTFAVAFPATNGVHEPITKPPTEKPWRGAGVALVADDEPAVREIAQSILTDAGFRVIEAKDGLEAVEAFRERYRDIDVVVLDRTMPRLDGREAFAIIRAAAPQIPVVFTSGYTDQIAEGLDPYTVLLSKPFRAAALTDKVREVMEA